MPKPSVSSSVNWLAGQMGILEFRRRKLEKLDKGESVERGVYKDQVETTIINLESSLRGEWETCGHASTTMPSEFDWNLDAPPFVCSPMLPMADLESKNFQWEITEEDLESRLTCRRGHSDERESGPDGDYENGDPSRQIDKGLSRESIEPVDWDMVNSLVAHNRGQLQMLHTRSIEAAEKKLVEMREASQINPSATMKESMRQCVEWYSEIYGNPKITEIASINTWESLHAEVFSACPVHRRGWNFIKRYGEQQGFRISDDSERGVLEYIKVETDLDLFEDEPVPDLIGFEVIVDEVLRDRCRHLSNTMASENEND